MSTSTTEKAASRSITTANSSALQPSAVSLDGEGSLSEKEVSSLVETAVRGSARNPAQTSDHCHNSDSHDNQSMINPDTHARTCYNIRLLRRNSCDWMRWPSPRPNEARGIHAASRVARWNSALGIRLETGMEVRREEVEPEALWCAVGASSGNQGRVQPSLDKLARTVLR